MTKHYKLTHTNEDIEIQIPIMVFDLTIFVILPVEPAGFVDIIEAI